MTQSRTRKFGPGHIMIGVGVLVCVGLMVAAILVAVHEYQRRDWPEATGQVVDVQTRTKTRVDSDGDRRTSTEWIKTISYSVDGQEYQFTTSDGGGPYEIGDTVQVRYNPADAADASIAGAVAWVPWMLGGMSVLFLLLFGGIGLILVRRGAGFTTTRWHRSAGFRRTTTIAPDGTRTVVEEHGGAAQPAEPDGFVESPPPGQSYPGQSVYPGQSYPPRR